VAQTPNDKLRARKPLISGRIKIFVYSSNIIFEVFTEVTMKKSVFCVVTLVALVRTDVSEEPSSSFIRVTRIGELGTTLVRASDIPSS
jgi:hypothetical protein